MVILFLHNKPISPNKGGIERVSFVLAKEFKAKGHKIIFLSIMPNELPVSDIGHDFHHLNINSNKEDFIGIFQNILKEHSPNIIINQWMNNDLLKALKSLRDSFSSTQQPKIFTVLHNRPFHLNDLGRKFKALTYPNSIKGKLIKLIGMTFPKFYIRQRNREFKRNFANFISVSDKFVLLSDLFIPRFLENMPEVNKNKIIAINNPNTFNISETPEKILKEKLIIFVGRLEDPQKNVKGFIDVWNEFYKLHPDWSANIIGDGPHREIFEKYAVRTKSKNLEFKGNTKDVGSFYRRASFMVLPSLYEGWPMVLAEAMSNECIPVVYDTYEATHDIITNKETGIIVKPFDAKLMAKCMDQLLKHSITMNQIAKKARQSIKNYNSNAIADKWLEIFEREKTID